MALMQFVGRPREPGISYAAQYVSGGPFGDLLEVARKVDHDAALAEVPALGVLLVRYLNVPDDHPARTDYVVVPDNHYLVYSEPFHLIYESDPNTFAREHTAAPGSS